MAGFRTPPVYEVWWVDAVSNREWADRDVHAGQKIALTHSVGYLLARTEKEIVLVQTLNALDQATESLSIPLCSTKRIRKR